MRKLDGEVDALQAVTALLGASRGIQSVDAQIGPLRYRQRTDEDGKTHVIVVPARIGFDVGESFATVTPDGYELVWTIDEDGTPRLTSDAREHF